VTDPVSDAIHAWATKIRSGAPAYANSLVARALTDIVASRATTQTVDQAVATKQALLNTVKKQRLTAQNAVAGYEGSTFSFNVTTTVRSPTVVAPATALPKALGGWITTPNVTVGTGLAISASTDKITATAHGMPNGTQVVLSAITGPTTVNAGFVYYVVSTTANDFQLAKTYGGTAVDIDTSGTVTVAKQPLPAGSLILDWQSGTPNGTITLTVPASASGTFTVTVQTGSLAVSDATAASLTAQKVVLQDQVDTTTGGAAILAAISDGRTALVAAGYYLAPRTITFGATGADPTTLVDETAALQTFFQTTVGNGTSGTPKWAVLWRNRVYRADSQLTVTSKSWWRYDCRGATIRPAVVGSATRVQMSLEGCSNFLVRPKLVGSLPAGAPAFDATYSAGQHGLQILGGTAGVIERPIISDAYGSGIRFASLSGVKPDGMEVRGLNSVDRCGNHILAVAACDNLEWHTVQMGASGRDTVAVSPAVGVVCNTVNLHAFQVTGAITGDRDTYFTFLSRSAGKVASLTIDGVVASAAHGPLTSNIGGTTSGTPYTDVIITDNVGAGALLNAARAGWVVANVNNLTFRRNTQQMATTQGRSDPVMYGLKGTTIGGTIDVGANTLSMYVAEALIDGTQIPLPVAAFQIASPTSLGPFTEGTSVSGGIQFTVANAVGTVSWSHSVPVSGTALPSGVSFSAGGLLTVNPAAGSHGSYTHRFTATDSTGPTDHIDLTFSVVVSVADLAISTTGSLDFVKGTDSTVQLSATGGVPPYHWSLNNVSSTMPTGFTLTDDADGLHGNVTADGSKISVTSGSGLQRTYKVTDSQSTPDTATKALSITVTAAASGSPPAFDAHHLGIVVPPVTGSHLDHVSTLMAAQPDLTVIRNQLDWSQAQPTKGVDPDFTRVGGFNGRLNCGLDSLVLVMSPPAWARPAGSGQHAYPVDPDDFGYFCGKAAAYIKTTQPLMRQRWEIFNEPNNDVFTDGVDPAGAAHLKKYALCLQAAYKAIKTAAPNALVGTGGTAPSGIAARKGPAWIAAMMPYMRAEFAASPSRYTKPAAGWHDWMACDRISHHPYSTGRLGTQAPKAIVATGPPVGSRTAGSFNAFSADTPGMANAVKAAVGVEMIFWHTEGGIKHHPDAVDGKGLPESGPNQGPYKNFNKNTQHQENWEINSEAEARVVLKNQLDDWFGVTDWPTGGGVAWPDGNTKKTTRTELYCYFHLGPDLVPPGGDLAIEVDGLWASNDVLKRVTGNANDFYEAFVSYQVP
jgi:hypothetical protein